AAHAEGRSQTSQHLSAVLSEHAGRTVAGYMPIGTEIDPRPAMAMAAGQGPVAIPVIEAAAKPLKFARWTPAMPLVPGAFKALIPADPVFITPDVLIVPLVAFDRSGARLGYGGGFYDRTLAMLRAAQPTLAIGFAFAEQEAAALPTEPTDEPLDLIITDREVIDLR
ncbi:MAG: 5-formyltetrahydrofolate cyclo-ligase, partial [Pseudomonadota bacterium]